MELKYLSCNFCCFRTRFLSLLLRHYSEEHANTPEFHVRCTVKGCLSSFRLVSSFRKHILRKHKDTLKELEKATNLIRQSDQVTMNDVPNFTEVIQGDDSDQEMNEISPLSKVVLKLIAKT